MAATVSIAELQKMSPRDLQREIRAQRILVARLHMQVRMNKEKDTAKYQRERRQLARMCTAFKSGTMQADTSPKQS